MNQQDINEAYAALCTEYGNLAISLKRIKEKMSAVEQKMVALDQLVPALLKSADKPKEPSKPSEAKPSEAKPSNAKT